MCLHIGGVHIDFSLGIFLFTILDYAIHVLVCVIICELVHRWLHKRYHNKNLDKHDYHC